jgi:7,8-dihydropterin-6-yl-methyl-4-(beta-D-ribofuranosyl)aminobenzene 5'-phosphate synthase
MGMLMAAAVFSEERGSKEEKGTRKRDPVRITVLYNNVAHDKRLATAWGMSCLVEGMEKTVLFDTGGDGRILLSNMKKLGKDPKQVDIVFLSHIHGDHVGGLWQFLRSNPDVIVYLPKSFPAGFRKRAGEAAAKVVSVKESLEITENICSTGELGSAPKEQALILKTPKGPIVVTGCAHPGVVNIVKRAGDICRKKVYLVLGGFHLMAYSEQKVEEIIRELKKLGVKKLGPSHCTGGKPIEMFRKAWGKDFLDLGCGAAFEIDTGRKPKK